MRIRLEPDGIDKYKIILPGRNNDFPIGAVWKDPFKGGRWRLKAYFTTMFKDEHIIEHIYDDSMRASRALAGIYQKLQLITSRETTDPFNFVWPDDIATD